MDASTFKPLYGPVYPDTLEEQLNALDTDEAVRRFATSRQRLAVDPYRPLYHFSPPENVMNDPNGLCHWQGRYHLFYQFRPDGIDRVHWGHTVSDDLIHWRDLPLALYPDTEKDCFSGQTLVEQDRVIAMYHGTLAGNAIATASDPLLLNWRKHPKNPVILGDTQNSGGANIVPIMANDAQYRVFDPCIWKEEDGYYALSGTYKDGVRGVDCVGVDHLFYSRDLTSWDYLGPLLEEAFFAEPGEDAAVPNFWPIGNGKHMLLLFSHKRSGRYYIGEYNSSTHRFTPQTHGRMNYGPWMVGSLHAPSATIDDEGRFLGIFNVKEGREPQGWNDIMTLPRHYRLDADNSLLMEPAGDIESLRFDHRHVDSRLIPANGETVLEGIHGKAMEIDAVIEPRGAREVGLCIFRSPRGEEQTRVSLYCQDHRSFGASSLQIDVSAASQSQDVFARTPEIGPLHLRPDEPLHLRIFLDRSVLEVYANGRQCLTIRVYPEREDSGGVSVFARGSEANLVSLDAWQMRSIWPELRHREGK